MIPPRWLRVLIAALVPLLWAVPGMRDLLHESDQAALVGGAVQLVRGATSWHAPGFYNYDKLYLSYWLLAAVLRVFGALSSTISPVAISNVFSSLALNAAAAWSILRAPRTARIYLALPVLLAPAFLLHASFFAAASLSAAALLAAFVLLDRRSSFPGHTGVLLAIFVAVGTRADAVLALPFLVWLTRWPQARPLAIFRRPIFFAMVVAAVLGLAVGRVAAGEASTTIFAPVFAAKIFAAYTIFGLGGAALLVAAVIGLLAGRITASAGAWRRLSSTAGLLTFVLPFAFYVPQLFSTRYWFLGLTTLLMFVLSRRGTALLQLSAPRVRTVVQTAALAAALGPLFVGVNLPFPNRPALTLTAPTRFPTADGLLPMGSYLRVMLWPAAGGGIADHNQAIWRASADVAFTPDASGRIPLLGTPMVEILRLRAAVNGLPARVIGIDEPPQRSYADLRSLVKFGGGLDAGGHLIDSTSRLLAQTSTRMVSPSVNGISILELQPANAAPDSVFEPWRIFRTIFSGNDFHLIRAPQTPGGSLALPLREGRSIALAASTAFQLIVTALDGREATIASTRSASDSRAQIIALDGRVADVRAVRFASTPPADAACAAAVLPDYMSVRSFQP